MRLVVNKKESESTLHKYLVRIFFATIKQICKKGIIFSTHCETIIGETFILSLNNKKYHQSTKSATADTERK